MNFNRIISFISFGALAGAAFAGQGYSKADTEFIQNMAHSYVFEVNLLRAGAASKNSNIGSNVNATFMAHAHLGEDLRSVASKGHVQFPAIATDQITVLARLKKEK